MSGFGMYYYLKKQYPLAIEYYKKALQKNPKEIEHYIRLGDVYYSSK